MTTDVINGVPRELLRDAMRMLEAHSPGSGSVESYAAQDIQALLATAQPAADGEREAFEAMLRTLPDSTGAIACAIECFDPGQRRYFKDEACSGLDLNSLFTIWTLARAAQPQQTVAGEHDPMRQLANTYKATAMMRAYEVRRLRETLEQIVACDWTSSESATDFAISQTKGHMISKIKRIARAALSTHKTGEEE